MQITKIKLGSEGDGIGCRFMIVPLLNWTAGVWIWFPFSWFLYIEWDLD